MFTLTLDAGRSGPLAAFDTPLLTDSPLQPDARVVLVLTMGAVPQVLLDGIVTETELTPGDRPQQRDARRHRRGRLAPPRPGGARRRAPRARRPPAGARDRWRPTRRRASCPPRSPPPVTGPAAADRAHPHPAATDLAHLPALADRHGYVATSSPGRCPGVSTLYWGPPVRVGLPQPALSVDLGPDSQRHRGRRPSATDALAPDAVDGRGAGPAASGSACRCTARPACGRRWPPCRCRRCTRPTCAPGGCARAAPATATARAARRRPWTAGADAVRRRGRGSTAAATAPCCARAGWSACAGPAGPTTGSGTCARSCTTSRPGSYRQTFTLAREGYGATVPVLPMVGYVTDASSASTAGRSQTTSTRMQRGRVQVTVPAVLGSGRLSWAEAVHPRTPATRSASSPCRRSGANVWVEFEAGDPDLPILAGCFWGTGEAPGAGLPTTKVLATDAITIDAERPPGGRRHDGRGRAARRPASRSSSALHLRRHRGLEHRRVDDRALARRRCRSTTARWR